MTGPAFLSGLPSDDWCIARLGDLVEVIRGVSYSKQECSSRAKHGYLPILRANNIGETLTFDELVFVDRKRIADIQLLQPGDIVVAASSGSTKVVGKAASLRTKWDGAFGAFCYAIRVDPAIESRFISAFLQTDEYRHQALALAKGTNIQNLRREHLTKLNLRLPPLGEQIRIADRIDELFTDLAAGVAALQRVRAKLKRYRSAVLHAAVTGKLTARWRAQHGPPAEPAEKLLARILDERRKQWEARTLAKYKQDGRQPPKNWRDRYPTPVEPKTDGLPELPAEWCWASVDQLLTEGLCNGISVKGKDTPPGVASLKLNALTENGFDYTAVRYIPIDRQTAEANAVTSGDFFVSPGNGSLRLLARGTLAQTPPMQVVFPDTMIRFRLSPFAHRVPSFWPSPLIRRQIERKAKTTAGIHKVSQSDLESIVLPLPPIEEQARLVFAMQEKFSQIDAMEAEVERGLARAARLRQAILKSAFAGKLVPQDPSDEPASVLLERIRQQRQSRRAESNGRPKRKTRAK